MGRYSFKVYASRPAGGLPVSPGRAREQHGGYLDVDAETGAEAREKALVKAKAAFLSFDVVRVREVK